MIDLFDWFNTRQIRRNCMHHNPMSPVNGVDGKLGYRVVSYLKKSFVDGHVVRIVCTKCGEEFEMHPTRRGRCMHHIPNRFVEDGRNIHESFVSPNLRPQALGIGLKIRCHGCGKEWTT